MRSPDPSHPRGAPIPATVHPPAQPAPSAVDTSRPFGAHLRMSWWKPLVLVLTMPLVLVVLQVLAYQLVGVIEGSDDPLSPELTPLKSLAVNLATGATGLVAVLLLVWMTRVPWRALFSSRRAFDRRRLAHYSTGAALLVGAGAGVVGAVAPASTGWTTLAVSGTTIAFLTITLLTTPVQAAGEELIYPASCCPRPRAGCVRSGRPWPSGSWSPPWGSPRFTPRPIPGWPATSSSSPSAPG
jgi:uncharacterized protein